MVSLPTADQKEFWEQRYQQAETGWNIGKAHPLLPKLVATLRQFVPTKASGRVLVPGAGHAHCAAYWAELDYQVTALDFAPSAITLAKQTYGHLKNLSFKQADLFQRPFPPDTFEIIFDRAMLCALPPHRRRDYIAAIESMTKSGGLFALITFADIDRKEGPPWPLTLTELSSHLSTHWDLLFAEDYEYEKKKPDHIILGESLSIWMRH